MELSGKTVFLVEHGDYEQRMVSGVFSSLDAAVAAIKAPYSSPYIVSWDEPKEDRHGEFELVGHFTRVEGYCGDGPIDWTIIPCVIDSRE